jgi:hypothetical protein
MNAFLGEIKIQRPVEQHRDVGAVGQDAADGLCNFRRGQPARRHLIQQRLEQVMIRPVHDREARVRVAEVLAERQSAEARTQHDDVSLFVPIHGLNVRPLAIKAIDRKWQPPRAPGNFRGEFAKWRVERLPGRGIMAKATKI